MGKFRQFSVVIHNVKENITDEVKQYVLQAKEHVMSVERYPQGDGYHLHLFIQYPNQRSFKSVLGDLQKFSRTIVTSKPEGEERDWGRVQLDVMKGSFKQAHDYLLGVTKDKPTGEVFASKKVSIPCEEIRRMIAGIFHQYYFADLHGFYDHLQGRPGTLDYFDDKYLEFSTRFSEYCYEEFQHEFED